MGIEDEELDAEYAPVILPHYSDDEDALYMDPDTYRKVYGARAQIHCWKVFY